MGRRLGDLARALGALVCLILLLLGPPAGLVTFVGWPLPESIPSLTAITEGARNGQRLELAWLRDPVEAFFLHIQGSGRVRLDDGQVMRVGFAGKNGHPYRSIGKILVERGLFALEDVTAQA